ncbi:hypothetical protein CLU79DRAFT_782829 [Phycomyces nitens]|nr:hypothetical protein CLU79DRAFT_782829 [Phycomyces nitens]
MTANQPPPHLIAFQPPPLLMKTNQHRLVMKNRPLPHTPNGHQHQHQHQPRLLITLSPPLQLITLNPPRQLMKKPQVLVKQPTNHPMLYPLMLYPQQILRPCPRPRPISTQSQTQPLHPKPVFPWFPLGPSPIPLVPAHCLLLHP